MNPRKQTNTCRHHDTKPIHGEEGFALWLTGLPAAGKSTTAKLIAQHFRRKGLSVEILESDTLRDILTPNPTYSEEERDRFYKAMSYIGHLLTKNGVNVIYDATAPRRLHRQYGRRLNRRFVEVYIKCSLKACMKRDPKGIYILAHQGIAKTVPGLQTPYEQPQHPDLAVDTENSAPREVACTVVDFVERTYGL